MAVSKCALLFVAGALTYTDAASPRLMLLSRSSAHKSSVAAEAESAMAVGMAARAAMRAAHKTSYWGTIHMGTPAQEFTVIFDTGSGNLILPTAECNVPACNKHRKYSSSSSTSSKKVDHADNTDVLGGAANDGHATITFGTGQVEGVFYQDRMCMDPDASKMCFDSKFIGATDETEQPFISTEFDGILGMGFADLSMGQGFNLLDDVVSSSVLPKNQFAFFLSDSGSSEITMGGYRAESAASPMVWAQVNKQSYWQIGISDITFNNHNTGLCSGGCQVAVDTGTSLLAGPSDVIDSLNQKLGVKEDCSNMDQLPMLGFALPGGNVLNLKPEDYVDKEDGQCSTSLMSLDVPPPKGPLFIFGDPFLRRFLTVFDKDQAAVGFAVAKHDDLQPGDVSMLIAKLAPGEAQTAPASAPAAPAPEAPQAPEAPEAEVEAPAPAPHADVVNNMRKMLGMRGENLLEMGQKNKQQLVSIKLHRTKRGGKRGNKRQ